jgi:hypothetical protein
MLMAYSSATMREDATRPCGPGPSSVFEDPCGYPPISPTPGRSWSEFSGQDDATPIGA